MPCAPSSVGFGPTDILLPRKGIDLTRFAVVACDQFTSQPEYWEQLDAYVGDQPSALRLIVPECQLDHSDILIPKIHAAMADYLDNGLLMTAVQHGYILTRRETAHGMRYGLLGALDLEQYNYTKGAKPLIRATEGTITSRIPPRMKVRRGARLESPHILVLLDDPAQTVIEPLAQWSKTQAPCYDTALNMDGGRCTGWVIDSADMLQHVGAALSALPGMRAEPPFLFAVGDGNHSLATAKACWEEKKQSLTAAQQAQDPARYALVEIENIHAPALVFEPIHRILSPLSNDSFLRRFQAHARQHGYMVTEGIQQNAQRLTVVSDRGDVVLSLTGHGCQPLTVGTLQVFLDDMLRTDTALRIDYIHEESAVRSLATGDTLGLLLPAMEKSELFPAVQQGGSLPRKTFSMGESREKRYYLECRAL